MPDQVLIGGEPAVTLTAPAADGPGPSFTSAQVLPGRALMLLQARAIAPGLGEVDIIASPSLAAAARRLGGGPGDDFGNAAFSFGGAILAPFANRIRGRETAGGQTVETNIAGHTVRLPANWGGKGPGAEIYAMHGLILDRAVRKLNIAASSVSGRIAAGDFSGRWPGELDLEIAWCLAANALKLEVTAKNVGQGPVPVGLGWHPYFALPSGRRGQARLRIPASSRALVNDYDDVLPTGEVVPVAHTPYDFRDSAPLGDLYLDDCFLDLERDAAGEVVIEIADPEAGLGVRVASPSASVTAIQTYAPLDQPFIVVEPQFNLADPYGAAWRGRATGMVSLAPGESTAYQARVELFSLNTDE